MRTLWVHDEWIDKGHGNIYACSKCGDMWLGVGGYNFCPNCGADMRGGGISDKANKAVEYMAKTQS